jgi:ribose transport system ATP-binding protein
VDGDEVPLDSPDSSREHGIGLVYQETSLVPPLSVGENVLLGRWPMRRGTVDWGRLHAEARRHLDRVGFDVDTHREVRELGMAERQLVELAKALSLEIRILLLDEPTSALSERETGRLFEICRALRGEGVAIVYVSHRLREIVEIADRITVLRDGAEVGTVGADGVQESELAKMMVGKSLSWEDRRSVERRSNGKRHLALRTRGLGRSPRLRPIDLELREGEIVMVFGLVGAGRTRLARTLFGLEPASEGSIEVLGRELRIGSPVEAIAAGIGYVGEDRAAGLVPKLSVAENITLATLDDTARAGVLDFRREREVAQRAVEDLGIRATSLDQTAETLSGGNQQKVVLARWMCSGARVLVLDDPTRGIDVGAKDEVFRLVQRLTGEGAAALYFTSEIEEARRLGDRILVMAEGGVVAEMPAHAPDDEIMSAAGGAHA